MKTIDHECDVLIVGGGISGLATAWWLAQKNIKVQVWEQTDQAGGKIQSNKIDGFQTEQAASMLMNFKTEVDQFLQQSELDKFKSHRLLNEKSKRYLIHQGKLQPLPMTISGLFFSPMWSLPGKLRLLLEPFIGRTHNNNESVSDFIRRRFGNEFLEKAMEPFIAGTLASDPDLACAQHVIPRLTALEKKFGSISAGILAHKITGQRTARDPESFSFVGGMQTLPKQLARDKRLGFHKNIQVQQLIQHNHCKNSSHAWEIIAEHHGEMIQTKAHHVVLSNPAHSAAQLVQPLDDQLSEILTQIKYAPLSVVHIGLERCAIQHPLDSAGFLVPRNEQINQQMKINGNLWMSSIFSQRAPENSVLLSSYLGGSRNPEMAYLSEQESIDQVLHDIQDLLKIKSHTTPMMGRINHHAQALPLYHDHYADKLQGIEQQLKKMPGLHIEANYIGGVSIRDRIASAQKTAQQIVDLLTEKSINSSPLFDFQETINKNKQTLKLKNVFIGHQPT